MEQYSTKQMIKKKDMIRSNKKEKNHGHKPDFNEICFHVQKNDQKSL